MPSSTSSSDRPGFVRQTASDRPGVAQPVPERQIPQQPWARIFWIALPLLAVLLTGWELHWRGQGIDPNYSNDDSHWAAQRRRIDEGEGGRTVLIGSSRTLFGVQLDVWQQHSGERPIQLALEGTSAVHLMEDLAADPDFTGKLLIGVAPDLFFSGGGFRKVAIDYYKKEGPSQRWGHWLSKTLLEPYFAAYDPDCALHVILSRQDWPEREGLRRRYDVPKLSDQSTPDRNVHMWAKVEQDAAYREYARNVWRSAISRPGRISDDAAKHQANIDKQIARAVAAAATLRARGVKMVFMRAPSIDEYYAFESRAYPRQTTWDRLLERTGLPGIHFEDYPALQTRDLPEWSHMSHAAARKYTAALQPLAEEAWRKQ